MRGRLGVDLQTVHVHQRFTQLQQRCDELGVPGGALRQLDAACGHGLLQGAPRLLRLGPCGVLRSGHIRGAKPRRDLAQRRFHRFARGRTAGGQRFVATQHARRQAPVHLHCLHQPRDGLGRRYATCLLAGIGNAAQGLPSPH